MDFALNGTQPPRQGNRDPWMAPHGVFPCAGEDAWLAIACASDREWRALAHEIDPALASDPRFADVPSRKAHEDALEARIAEWTRTQDPFSLTERLQAAGVPACPSQSAADLVQDPQLLARGFFERLEHPGVGRRTHAGIPGSSPTAETACGAPPPSSAAHRPDPPRRPRLHARPDPPPPRRPRPVLKHRHVPPRSMRRPTVGGTKARGRPSERRTLRQHYPCHLRRPRGVPSLAGEGLRAGSFRVVE